MTTAARPVRAFLSPTLLTLLAILVSNTLINTVLLDFQGRIPYEFAQFLDLTVLERQPLRSLWVLHSQPPLQNLLLAVLVNAFGAEHILAPLRGIYLLLSTVGLLLVYRLLRVFLTPWSALTMLALFSLSPSYLLYANWPYSVLVALVLVNLLLYAMITPSRQRAVGAGLLSGALLGLHHGLFHPAILSPVLAAWAVLLVRRHQCSAGFAVGMVILALLPSLAVMTKNKLVFGSFSSSSWLGCNLSQVTRTQSITALQAIVTRQQDLPQLPAALGQLRKIDPGHPEAIHYNFNHFSALQICRQALSEAATWIRGHPGDYLKHIVTAMRASLSRFSSDYLCCSFDRANLGALQGLVDRLNELPAAVKLIVNIAWLLLLPLLLSPAARRQGLLMPWLSGYWLTISLLLASHALNGGEQERMRFMLAGYAWMVLALGLAEARRGFSAVSARPPGQSTSDS